MASLNSDLVTTYDTPTVTSTSKRRVGHLKGSKNKPDAGTQGWPVGRPRSSGNKQHKQGKDLQVECAFGSHSLAALSILW